jgi:hypothetical protein
MMDPLDVAGSRSLNFEADLDCQVCGEYVPEGHYDGSTLTWWCKQNHESKLEKFFIG